MLEGRPLAFPPRAAADAAAPPPRYLVTLKTPKGEGQIEVPSFLGPEAAGRRAHISACAVGWGDLDEVEVVEVALLT